MVFFKKEKIFQKLSKLKINLSNEQQPSYFLAMSTLIFAKGYAHKVSTAIYN